MPARSKSRTLSLKISVSPEEKAMLSKAARTLSTTVSRFVLRKACEEAECVLATPTHFQLTFKQWNQFQRALDAKPKKVPALRALLTKPGVFDG